MTIMARVPDTHTVPPDIEEHGSVLIGGKTYTPFDVPHLESLLRLSIKGCVGIGRKHKNPWEIFT